jgi:hypothetical protein
MRFLADGGISPRTVDFLRGINHHALYVRDLQVQRAIEPSSSTAPARNRASS